MASLRHIVSQSISDIRDMLLREGSMMGRSGCSNGTLGVSLAMVGGRVIMEESV
jgi:hypothetical protein